MTVEALSSFLVALVALVGIAALWRGLRRPAARVEPAPAVDPAEVVARRMRELDELTEAASLELSEQGLAGACEPDRALADAVQLIEGRSLVQLHTGPLPLVAMHHRRLTQVLVELLRNAVVRASRVRVCAMQAGDQVIVTVDDNGPGFDPELAGRAFEPGVSGRDGGEGLGLSLCLWLVGEAGGTIQVGRGDFGGACLSLALPVALSGDSSGDRLKGPCVVSLPS